MNCCSLIHQHSQFLLVKRLETKQLCLVDGQFGAKMQVLIQNDGPVTIQLESPTGPTDPKQVSSSDLFCNGCLNIIFLINCKFFISSQCCMTYSILGMYEPIKQFTSLPFFMPQLYKQEKQQQRKEKSRSKGPSESSREKAALRSKADPSASSGADGDVSSEREPQSTSP